jgi:hypothetical protein
MMNRAKPDGWVAPIVLRIGAMVLWLLGGQPLTKQSLRTNRAGETSRNDSRRGATFVVRWHGLLWLDSFEIAEYVGFHGVGFPRVV